MTEVKKEMIEAQVYGKPTHPHIVAWIIDKNYYGSSDRDLELKRIYYRDKDKFVVLPLFFEPKSKTLILDKIENRD